MTKMTLEISKSQGKGGENDLTHPLSQIPGYATDAASMYIFKQSYDCMTAMGLLRLVTANVQSRNFSFPNRMCNWKYTSGVLHKEQPVYWV